MSPLKKAPSLPTKRPPIILLTGASGAGKSTVADALLQEKKLPLVKFVTCTTRPKRPGERNGRDYHFLSRKEFEKRAAKNEFYEKATVYGEYYGSSRREMKRHLKGKKAILIVIDVQGTRTIKRFHPESIAIFLDAPTKELKARLYDRGADVNDLDKRFRQIAAEKRFRTHADTVIMNGQGNLKKSIQIIEKIVREAIHPPTD